MRSFDQAGECAPRGRFLSGLLLRDAVLTNQQITVKDDDDDDDFD